VRPSALNACRARACFANASSKPVVQPSRAVLEPHWKRPSKGYGQVAKGAPGVGLGTLRLGRWWVRLEAGVGEVAVCGDAG